MLRLRSARGCQSGQRRICRGSGLRRLIQHQYQNGMCCCDGRELELTVHNNLRLHLVECPRYVGGGVEVKFYD